MSEVTRILSAIEHGDPAAAEQLLPLVYDELRRLAAQRLTNEHPGLTLQATALVHEAYLRLVDGAPAQPWNGRGAKEVGATVPVPGLVRVHQAQVGFVDQRGGLQGLPGLLLGQSLGGERAQFLVH